MPRAISRCPNCREPVSPFAAGCALCGTDLEAARKELAAKQAARPSVALSRRLPVPRGLGDRFPDVEWLPLVAVFLLALFVSWIGLVAALYMSVRYQNDGNRPMMWSMFACAALACWALLDPVWFLQHVWGV